MNCKNCNDTGKVGNSRYLDCAHCDVAEARTRLEAIARSMRNLGDTDEDVLWHIYNLGLGLKDFFVITL